MLKILVGAVDIVDILDVVDVAVGYPDFAHLVAAAGVVGAVGGVDVVSGVPAFGFVLAFEVVTVVTAFEGFVSATDVDVFAAHMGSQCFAANISAATCIFGPA